MKKVVAVFIVLYFISMGIMVGWGFLAKQSSENARPAATTPAQPTNTQTNQSSSSNSSAQTGASTSYSLADVAKHKSQTDCWLAINGNVYNVTNYLDYHPGGADIILMFCGQDATQAYNTKGGRGSRHSGQADAQLAQYIIGTVK